MKKFTKPDSKLTRFFLGAFAIWVSGTIFVFLYNKYKHGADLDSVSDLFLISLAPPTAVALAGLFFWLSGTRVLILLMGIAVSGFLILVAWPAYQEKSRQAHLQAQIEMRKEEISKIAAARCANKKKSSQPNAIDDYSICVVSQSLKIKMEMQRGER